MRTMELKKDFFWAGVLDKDLRVFDIVMYTEFGTTYNSYILKCGGKTVLFETAKAKFYEEYRKTLTEELDIKDIDYIIMDHTEPDHAGSIEKILEVNPRVKIIATSTAIGFLKHIVNRDFYSIPVKDKEEIEIGGKTFQFFAVPNLHWPDTMYTYIKEDKTLVTCDSFGSHYAHEGILRSTVTNEDDYMKATKYYFDNILGPFKQPYMTDALKIVRSLDIDMICPGHGPVLDSHIEELLAIYDEWCKIPGNDKTTVVIPYVSAYGYTEELAEKIEEGIKEAGDIDVKKYDMVKADQAEVLGEIGAADGILFGTPTILGDALKPIWDLTTAMFPPIHGGKLGSAFGSYGWNGRGVYHIVDRLKQLQLETVDGFRVRFKPSEKDLEEALEFGYDFGLHLVQKEAPQRKKPSARSTLVKCLVCGEIFDSSYDLCPVCGVGRENFVPVDDMNTGFRDDVMEKVVILGGGTAALNAAKAVRQRNVLAEIIMVSEENELPYERPKLTKNMFGENKGGVIAVEDKEWYEQNRIELKLNSRVKSLEPMDKTVVLEDGTMLPYDKCIYALGSRSNIPKIENVDLPEAVAVRSIRDVEKINDLALKAKTAVVIGGGILGMEAAWELRKEKLEVTVLEGTDAIMKGKIDSTAAEILTNVASKCGIRIKLNAHVKAFLGKDHLEGVLLEDGTKLEADMVILSAGVVPNKEVAEAAGLAVNRAVVVSEMMETSMPDIYACGDCAEFDDVNLPLWSVASEMGRVAGANAAGETTMYIPEVQGLSLAAMNTNMYAIGDVGTKEGVSYKTMEIRDDKKGILEKYYFRNDIISGAILLGDLSALDRAVTAVQEQKTFRKMFR